MTDWRDIPIESPRIGPLNGLTALLRGVVLGTVTYSGLILLLLLRLIERPLHGLNRPWTPYITQAVCRAAFPIMGLRITVTGTPMVEKGAVDPNALPDIAAQA